LRENADAKGRRLLSEGRVQVTRVDQFSIRALCRGDDGAVYDLGFDGDWYCSCPARSPRCSHLVALKLVTIAIEVGAMPA
jgi:hypothetical protein